MNREIDALVQRALNSSAQCSSLIRKLVAKSPHAHLKTLELRVLDLQTIRAELCHRLDGVPPSAPIDTI